jgi:hypothetical protein
MRKGLAIALLAAAFVLLLAAPALATKDPFKPLVTSGSATNDTTDGTDAAPITGQDEPGVIGVPEDDSEGESLPSTGTDPSGWLVLSYALVVAGGATLVVSRTLRPARW